jgi:hypothetical protein
VLDGPDCVVDACDLLLNPVAHYPVVHQLHHLLCLHHSGITPRVARSDISSNRTGPFKYHGSNDFTVSGSQSTNRSSERPQDGMTLQFERLPVLDQKDDSLGGGGVCNWPKRLYMSVLKETPVA